MKKQLIALLLIILVIGCKKQSNTANKSSGGSSATQTNVSCAEALLIGKWTFDSAVYYQNNIPVNIQVASEANLNNFEYDVYNTPYSGGSIDYKNISFGRVGQNQTATFWYVTDLYFSSTGLLSLHSGSVIYFSGYIISLSANNLVTSANFGAIKQGQYYYLHK